MFSVKFSNGKFLGLTMDCKFVYAFNPEFRYSFDSIEKIEKMSKFFLSELKETEFEIVQNSGKQFFI